MPLIHKICDTFYKKYISSWLKSCEIFLGCECCCPNDPIRSQIGTCRDIWAVMHVQNTVLIGSLFVTLEQHLQDFDYHVVVLLQRFCDYLFWNNGKLRIWKTRWSCFWLEHAKIYNYNFTISPDWMSTEWCIQVIAGIVMIPLGCILDDGRSGIIVLYSMHWIVCLYLSTWFNMINRDYVNAISNFRILFVWKSFSGTSVIKKHI